MKATDVVFVPILLLLVGLVYFTSISAELGYVIVFLLGGGFILIKGSDLFVEGAIAISERLGVSEHTIGLTVVAFGTSLPELAVSSIASVQGHAETAWGNVLGSNVTNIALVLGASMIITYLIPSKYAYRDSISMFAVTIITVILAADGHLQWHDGLALISLYMFFVFILHRRTSEENVQKEAVSVHSAFPAIFLGIGGIAVGADAVVHGAIDLSELFGVREIAIAASIVALGTSLPEFSTSIIAAVKKHHGIAVGNVIGSNLMNIGLVLGFASVLRNISVNVSSIPVLFLVTTAATIPLILRTRRINRVTGAILLMLYGVFVVTLFIAI